MVALSKNLNLTPDYILKKLPLAKGQQYLVVIAKQNGQHPVWPEDGTSFEQQMATVSEVIRNAFNNRRREAEMGI